MVDWARDSMDEPMVADQRDVRREGFEQAVQMARVCERKSGSRRTSASSRTSKLTAGRGRRLSLWLRWHVGVTRAC